MGTTGAVPVVLLQDIQESWSFFLVEAHLTLILHSPADGLSDLDQLVGLILKSEHLVKGEL